MMTAEDICLRRSRKKISALYMYVCDHMSLHQVWLLSFKQDRFRQIVTYVFALGPQVVQLHDVVLA